MNRILSLVGVILVVGCGPEGPPDGPFEEYHDNGQLKSKMNFIEGSEQGLWEDYNKKGKLIK